jgi:alpha-galactosidase
MSEALKATGRPIVYSLSIGGENAPWEWGPSVGLNLWRDTQDISANWDRIYTILNLQAGLAHFAGPGHWNDPDMLEVGNGKLTLAENRSHFSMWAILAAPLIAGNDLSKMTPEVKAILTNRDVIAIDQDKLGQEGTRIYSDGEREVWARHLTGGALAIAVLNPGSNQFVFPFHLNMAKLGLAGPQTARNLWTGESIVLSNDFPIQLAGHDVFLVRIDHPKVSE